MTTPPDAGQKDAPSCASCEMLRDTCERWRLETRDERHRADHAEAALTTHAETIRRLEGEVAALAEGVDYAMRLEEAFREAQAILEDHPRGYVMQHVDVRKALKKALEYAPRPSVLETIRRLEGEVARAEKRCGEAVVAMRRQHEIAAVANERADAAEGLLTKYMVHVGREEGTDFLEFRGSTIPGAPDYFSDEEWALLQKARTK